MYLPKSKYTVKHATWGIFKLKGSPEGEFYVGPYIEDYLGRFYAGKDFVTAQKRPLVKIDETVVREEPGEIVLGPQEENYQSGSYVRYFRKNTVSRVCEEVTKDKFEAESSSIWKTCSITWILTGSLDDYYIGDYLKRGVRYENTIALFQLENKLPGIVEILELKPEEFVEEIKINP